MWRAFRIVLFAIGINLIFSSYWLDSNKSHDPQYDLPAPRMSFEASGNEALSAGPAKSRLSYLSVDIPEWVYDTDTGRIDVNFSAYVIETCEVIDEFCSERVSRRKLTVWEGKTVTLELSSSGFDIAPTAPIEIKGGGAWGDRLPFDHTWLINAKGQGKRALSLRVGPAGLFEDSFLMPTINKQPVARSENGAYILNIDVKPWDWSPPAWLVISGFVFAAIAAYPQMAELAGKIRDAMRKDKPS